MKRSLVSHISLIYPPTQKCFSKCGTQLSTDIFYHHYHNFNLPFSKHSILTQRVTGSKQRKIFRKKIGTFDSLTKVQGKVNTDLLCKIFQTTPIWL